MESCPDPSPLLLPSHGQGPLSASSLSRPKRICMLSHNNYETDNRVRRYAETLARRGDHVDVIALSGGKVPLGTETINGVNVFRVQHRNRDERHKWTHAWRTLRFLLVSSLVLTWRHFRVRYDVIHVHNLPDFLVFAAWYPKLTGTKLILDIHDIMPELFASKFGARSDDRYVRLLRWIEKASTAFADHVIVSNDLWRETLTTRSVAKEKCSVFINHVDPALFYRRVRTRQDGKFIILFPGSFQWHQGLDIAIEAFARLQERVPNAEFHIYGGGNLQPDLLRLAESLGLKDRVKFCGSVSLEEVADIMANADMGVVPKRADSFGNEAYSTKIMEFLSQGVPVVASRTKIDTFYFDDSVVRFFTSGDPQSMADAMLELIEDRETRETSIRRGYEYVDRNHWDRHKSEYLELVDALARKAR